MTCKITMRAEGAIIHDWSDECATLIEAVLQPLENHRRARSYATTQLRAHNVAEFLKSNGVSVRMFIEEASMHDRLNVWTRKLRATNEDFSVADVDEFIARLGVALRPLQVAGIHKVLRAHFALIAVRCGGGKTLLNLAVAQALKWKKGRVLTVVVAPSSCASEYEKELGKHRSFFDLTMVNLCGLSKGAVERILAETEADVIVVSVDSVHALERPLRETLRERGDEGLLILEEGHSAKNCGSRRFLSLQNIAPAFGSVIVSTATPMPLDFVDLRSYLALVGLPQPVGAYRGGLPAEDYEFFRGVTFVTDEDDLPYAPVRSVEIEWNTPEDLNARVVSAALKEIAEGRKVLIFTATNQALEAAFDLFDGIPRVVLSGSFHTRHCSEGKLISGRSPEAQKAAIDQFNNDPECMIMIANFRVGSTGLNLQHSGARMSIYYEITNSGADLFQSMFRTRRPHTFPPGGFINIFAVPSDPKRRCIIDRQFLKLANQERVLKRLKNDVRRSS